MFFPHGRWKQLVPRKEPRLFSRAGLARAPVPALRAHRCFTKRRPQGSAPLQPYAIISSAFRLFFFFFFSLFIPSSAHDDLALPAGFSLSLRSPVSAQPPVPSAISGDGASPPPPTSPPPARQKPRYPRSSFTAETPQCHPHREGAWLEHNARRAKPRRHLPDANPMVERERLY